MAVHNSIFPNIWYIVAQYANLVSENKALSDKLEVLALNRNNVVMKQKVGQRIYNIIPIIGLNTNWYIATKVFKIVLFSMEHIIICMGKIIIP